MASLSRNIKISFKARKRRVMYMPGPGWKIAFFCFALVSNAILCAAMVDLFLLVVVVVNGGAVGCIAV